MAKNPGIFIYEEAVAGKVLLNFLKIKMMLNPVAV